MSEVVLTAVCLLAFFSLTAPDLLTAVIVSSVVSLLSCLLFLVWGAPDVALTEAAVGTGVGSVVFIWIVFKTERKVRRG